MRNYIYIYITYSGTGKRPPLIVRIVKPIDNYFNFIPGLDNSAPP